MLFDAVHSQELLSYSTFCLSSLGQAGSFEMNGTGACVVVVNLYAA